MIDMYLVADETRHPLNPLLSPPFNIHTVLEREPNINSFHAMVSHNNQPSIQVVNLPFLYSTRNFTAKAVRFLSR